MLTTKARAMLAALDRPRAEGDDAALSSEGSNVTLEAPGGSIRVVRLIRIGPGKDLLECSGRSSGRGKPGVRGVGFHRRRYVDRECSRIGIRRHHRVRNRHRQVGPVIHHVHLEDIAAMQIGYAHRERCRTRTGRRRRATPPSQIGRRNVGRIAPGVQPRGVVAFPIVVEQIEFHRHALGEPRIS